MSNTKPSKKIVPTQETVSKSDASHSVKMDSTVEAMHLFSMAKNRLLDVTNWDKLCGPLAGKFHLTDNAGNEIKGLAISGDYLKIDLPAPDAAVKQNYDWVKIEAIEEDRPDLDTEEIVIKVRPAPNPTTNSEEPAHFFENKAVSTFIVKRKKNVVKAEVRGRTELSDLHFESSREKIKNALLTFSGMFGFSSSQWKKLVKGLVSLKKLR